MCLCVCLCARIHKHVHIIFKAGNVVHSWVVSCLPNTPGAKPKPPQLWRNHLLSSPIFYSFPSLHRHPLLPQCLFLLSRSSSGDLHMSGYFSGLSSLSLSILPRLFWVSHLKQFPACPTSHLSIFSVSRHYLTWCTCLFCQRTVRTPLGIWNQTTRLNLFFTIIQISNSGQKAPPSKTDGWSHRRLWKVRSSTTDRCPEAHVG